MKTSIRRTRTNLVVDITITSRDAAALADIIQYAGNADLAAGSQRLYGVFDAIVEYFGKTAYSRQDGLARKARDQFAAELLMAEERPESDR